MGLGLTLVPLQEQNILLTFQLSLEPQTVNVWKEERLQDVLFITSQNFIYFFTIVFVWYMGWGEGQRSILSC